MNLFQKKAVWFSLLLFGAALIIFPYVFKDGPGKNDPISKPSVSASPIMNPAISVKPSVAPPKKPANTPIITKEKPVLPTSIPRSLITGPATCQLGGSIEFINENLYETKGAKINYQNVDDPIRLIYWKVAPDDGALRVGPNAFSQFSNLPNGEKEIGVSLNKPAAVKSYILTAVISYGVIKPNGAEEVRNSDCSGSIAVTLP